MCNLEQLTTTDRVLLGQHVAVTAPTLQRSREHVTRVAKDLKASGHHVYHSIGKVVLDNGGTLEALTLTCAHEQDPDRIVHLTGVPTGGAISRR